MASSSPSLSLSAADAVVASIAGHAVWRGDPRAAHADPSGTPTGFAELDAELPGGGWPAGGLVDLLQPAPAGAELRLLAPLLGAGTAPGLPPRPIVCIAPPAEPCAPALAALGIALDRLVWLSPGSVADAAWSAEQALRSAACAAVLWWSSWEPPRSRAGIGGSHPALWRRLHLAAQAGASPLFALRPLALRAQASPAPLRLALTPAAGGVDLLVFKRRGPPMAQPLRLALRGRALDAAAAGSGTVPARPSFADAPSPHGLAHGLARGLAHGHAHCLDSPAAPSSPPRIAGRRLAAVA